METLDCRGLPCPEPVLRTKAHLETYPGIRVAVVVDNEASRENVLRFARSRGCEGSAVDTRDGCFSISIQPGEESVPVTEFDEDSYGCEVPTTGNLVYVISSDCMGRGSEELGWALLQTYVSTIAELSPLPSHILLYNGGVRLSSRDGKALEALQLLEKKGVTVWICGTCLEFFKLEEERKVGSITNMYDIMNTMATAAKIVSPF